MPLRRPRQWRNELGTDFSKIGLGKRRPIVWLRLPAVFWNNKHNPELRKDRRLRFMERLVLRKVTSASQRELGNLRLAQADARQARAYYKHALTTYPSLRSLIKYLVSLISSRFALLLVRRGKNLDTI